MLLKLNLIFDPYTTNEMGQVVTLIPCIQSAVTTSFSGGYREGGVELVLPILVKVYVYYNGFLFGVIGLSDTLPLED